MSSGSGLVRTSWLKLITGYYISPNLVLSCPVFALLSLACHHVHFPVPIHTQNSEFSSPLPLAACNNFLYSMIIPCNKLHFLFKQNLVCNIFVKKICIFRFEIIIIMTT